MITSLANEKIKEVAKLNQKKYRDKTGRFLIEGRHLVDEARRLGLLDVAFSLDEEEVQISDLVMRKITNTDSIVSICGVARRKAPGDYGNRILILDGIQDPGNMGTLIRSAVSFGFMTILIGKNSVDPYSPKVVRSTQGAIFQCDLFFVDVLSEVRKLKESSYFVYGTALINGVPLKEVKKRDKIAIILGNEGNGIQEDILAGTDCNIFIEMKNMESLNVSVAGSIIMYELGE